LPENFESKFPRIFAHASAPNPKPQDNFSEPAAQDFLSAPFPHTMFPVQTSIQTRLVSAGPMRFQKREEKRRKENTEEENTSDHLIAQTPTSSAPCKQTNQMSQRTTATKPTNKLKSIVSSILKAVNQVHRNSAAIFVPAGCWLMTDFPELRNTMVRKRKMKKKEGRVIPWEQNE
jgi:hypothetical protein